MEPKLYGVSFGNGNDGVSHMFADYYVRTTDPWLLATAAMIGSFKPGAGMGWAQRHMEVDGEADYTITACLYNPPSEDTVDGEYTDVFECEECGATANEGGECGACHAGHLVEKDPEDIEDGRNWSDANGAWMLCEVFPADKEETRDRPVYDSIEEALEPNCIALARAAGRAHG